MTKKERIAELTDQLNELQLPLMAASLESLFHSKDYNELDSLTILERIVEPEYQEKQSQRFQNRLKRAHLAGGPQSIEQCKDSNERIYLPSDITSTLSSLDFIKDGLNV